VSGRSYVRARFYERCIRRGEGGRKGSLPGRIYNLNKRRKTSLPKALKKKVRERPRRSGRRE